MRWDHQHNQTKNPIQRNRMAKYANDHETAPIHSNQFSINVNTEHKPTSEIKTIVIVQTCHCKAQSMMYVDCAGVSLNEANRQKFVQVCA